MSSLPPIPDIGGDVDLVLDVYTHASVRRPSITQMNEEYGDTDRLAELGANALDLVVTNHFYRVRPFLSGREIQDRRNEVISDTNLEIWLRLYRMKEKLQIAPAVARSTLDDPVEMRKYFHIFLGAVFVHNGLSAIQEWISALIDWSSASTTSHVTLNGANVTNADTTAAVDGSAGSPA